MEKETLMLRAIMERFGSLTALGSALRDDADTTIENLVDDTGNEASYGDFEDYIQKIL